MKRIAVSRRNVEGVGVARTRRHLLAKLGIAAATLALAAPALTACDGAPENTSSGELKKIVVGANPIIDLAPLWVGKDQGIFAKHGIDLDIQTGAGGAALVPGVVSGQFSFTFVNPTTLFVARDKGLDLQVVSNVASSTGTTGTDSSAILVKSDSAIKSPKDLAGKTVAVNTLNSIGTTVIRQSVRKDGGDPDSIKFVETGFPDMMAALSSNHIDAAWEVEPFISRSLNEGYRAVSWPYVDTAPELPIALAVTSGQNLEQNKELVANFVAALHESTTFANENRDAVKKIVPTYTGVKAEQADKIFFPLWTPDINRDGLKALAELTVSDRILKAAPNLDELLP